MHRAGFVSIVGLPNAGKSTLLNALVGEKLSIVTPKPQTTRQRLKAIVTKPDYQIIFFDTPGIVQPKYKLHETMMHEIDEALADADAVLLVTDARTKMEEHVNLETAIRSGKKKWLLALNKGDIVTPAQRDEAIATWSQWFDRDDVVPVSALAQLNLETLLQKIIQQLPEHPPYFDADELTDKSTRYFVSEMIREQLLLQFREEIPYAAEVYIEEFKELEHLTRIRAVITVERESQKAIILGNRGANIKALGMAARATVEAFIGGKAYLELSVKVKANWRNDPNALRQFGYRK